MAKYINVIAKEIDTETNEQKELLNEEYSGFTLLGTCRDEKRMNEVIIHDTIASIASKLASGSKTSLACKLAQVIMNDKADRVRNTEDSLFGSILNSMLEDAVGEKEDAQ